MSNSLTSASPIRFRTISLNSKLREVLKVDKGKGRPMLLPVGPHCSSAAVAGAVTCPRSCEFNRNGCYAQSGAAGYHNRRLDETAIALELSASEVIDALVDVIDRSFPRGVPQDGGRDGHDGRDLRLNTYGDVTTSRDAQKLGGAARRHKKRGGGSVWLYTRWWRQIERLAFGPISALASVDAPHEIEEARRRGYAAAIVVPEFPEGPRSFRLPGVDAKLIPCPAQTVGKTCVTCRLCLDRDLLSLGAAIAFAPHGRDRRQVRKRLTVLAPNSDTA